MRETVGVVPLEGRGSLPFEDLHGEPLFLHALRALTEAVKVPGRLVVTVEQDRRASALDVVRRSGLSAQVEAADSWWRELGTRGAVTVVAHDPLCPLVPAEFLARCLAPAAPSAPGTPVVRRTGDWALVAYRPVTDTLKAVVDDRIVDTLDRELFGIVTSPVVFGYPLGAAATAPVDEAEVPPVGDFARLASWLRDRVEVELRRSPSLGRRVDDPSAVNLLACMDEMARTVQET